MGGTAQARICVVGRCRRIGIGGCRGYEAARALVELVGCDAGRATVVEMDGFDGRFVCGGCKASGRRERGGRR